jgi:A/G-specific adenine glycosylase
MPSTFAARLLDWFAINARQLPWRDACDPYRIWVSEVMLQQTRVETVIPYYHRWMARFPTISSIAQAPLQSVLAAWEGLGYYSRARNLHRAARLVMSDHGGILPSDPKLLKRLPGIGRYTAAAIASIAFGMDEPALDGNIRRVLARVFEVRTPARSTGGEKQLWQLAADHLPAGQASAYNQAMMDLGALVCTPKSPNCPACPLQEICIARALTAQEQFPVLQPKKEIPHHHVTAAVIHRNSCVLIAQRPHHGLLGGMWEFPGGKLQPGEDLVTCLKREINEELAVDIQVGASLGVFRHAYTHFRVTLHAFVCLLLSGEPRRLEHHALAWVSPEHLQDYPMGKLDRQIAGILTAQPSLPALQEHQLE